MRNESHNGKNLTIASGAPMSGGEPELTLWKRQLWLSADGCPKEKPNSHSDGTFPMMESMTLQHTTVLGRLGGRWKPWCGMQIVVETGCGIKFFPKCDAESIIDETTDSESSFVKNQCRIKFRWKTRCGINFARKSLKELFQWLPLQMKSCEGLQWLQGPSIDLCVRGEES